MYIGNEFINPYAVVNWYFSMTRLYNRYIHINFVDGSFKEIYTDRWATGIHLNEEEIDKQLKDFIMNRVKGGSNE